MLSLRAVTKTMRIDGFVPCDTAFSTHEVASKLGGYNNHVQADMLKIDIESLNAGKEGTASSEESESYYETDMSLYDTSAKPHSYADIKDFINSDQNDGEHIEAPYSLPTGTTGVVEQVTDYYTEKTLTKLQLLEMIACSTKGTYTVKGICIDEGVHSFEAVSIDGNENQNVSSRFKKTVRNKEYDITNDMTDSTKEMTGGTKPNSNYLESSSANEHVGNDGKNQCSSCCLLACGSKSNKVVPSAETSSEEQLLPLLELEKVSCKVDSSRFVRIDDQEISFDHRDTEQGIIEKRNSTSTTVTSSATESDTNESIGSSNGETKEKPDNLQSQQSQDFVKAEVATQEITETSARCSFVQQGYADSSLLGPAYLSAPLVSSGHIPYSGSISLRSDSSTTSVRSFAFPILQSEWNSSPVRMAKAHRRHRGWGMGLLCCRF